MRRSFNRASATVIWAMRAATVVLLAVSSDSAVARTDPTAICDRAAIQIADETEVPLDVLRALTRTEPGRGTREQMQPWPWTVNMEGQGVWFDTEAQAQGYVFRHFRTGARSFDIGCFQINYKWHGHAFANIEEMFDPLENARYAAHFLTKLYGEHGDWTRAVGAYHSRTQKYAARYLNKYRDVQDTLPGEQQAPPATGWAARGNGRPLLSGGSNQGRTGSLVPQDSGQAGSLFAPQQGG